jgi:hypothetical protein
MFEHGGDRIQQFGPDSTPVVEGGAAEDTVADVMNRLANLRFPDMSGRPAGGGDDSGTRQSSVPEGYTVYPGSGSIEITTRGTGQVGKVVGADGQRYVSDTAQVRERPDAR